MSKSKIEITFSFLDGYMHPDLISECLTRFVNFTPDQFHIGSRIFQWGKGQNINIFTDLQKGSSAIFDKQGNFFGIYKTCTSCPFWEIIVEIESNEIDLLARMTTEVCSSFPGLVSAYMTDADYRYVQTTPSESNIKLRNVPAWILKTLDGIPSKFDVWDNREFETRFNPGRSSIIAGTVLMAASKMWFGYDFYRFVSKERIGSFPFANKISDVGKDGLLVSLFEDVLHSHTPENRFRQFKWHEWIDFEGLEKKYV